MTQSSSEIFEPISIKRFSKIRNRGSARWNPWISFSLSRENRVCFIQNRLDFEQICIFYNFGRFRVGKSWPRFRSSNQLAPGDNQLMVSIRFELNHGGWSFLTTVIMLMFNFAYKKYNFVMKSRFSDCKLVWSRELFMILTFCQMHKMFISDSNSESDVITLKIMWRHVTTTVVELVFVRGHDVIFPVIRIQGF